jgi:hypothetical protein
MDRKAEEASEVPRKSAVILSDRSREIIRLFEERERKRHQAEQNAEPVETREGGLVEGVIRRSI